MSMLKDLFNNWEQPNSSDRLELVFADRIKDYGAYKIRTMFSKNQVLATVIASLIALTAAGLPVLLNNTEEVEEERVIVTTSVDDIKEPEDEKEEEKEPPKIEEPVLTTQAYVVPDINPNASEDDNLNPPDAVNVVGAQDQIGSDELILPDDEIVDNSGGTGENKGPSEVKIKAQFPGGDEKFKEFVVNNFQYPIRCQDDGINGYVMLRFVVDEVGRVSRVSAVDETPSCPEFTTEAIRVLKKSPRWIPGNNNGVMMKSWREIPIKLNITDP
jgi:protein TonB